MLQKLLFILAVLRESPKSCRNMNKLGNRCNFMKYVAIALCIIDFNATIDIIKLQKTKQKAEK